MISKYQPSLNLIQESIETWACLGHEPQPHISQLLFPWATPASWSSCLELVSPVVSACFLRKEEISSCSVHIRTQGRLYLIGKLEITLEKREPLQEGMANFRSILKEDSS